MTVRMNKRKIQKIISKANISHPITARALAHGNTNTDTDYHKTICGQPGVRAGPSDNWERPQRESSRESGLQGVETRKGEKKRQIYKAKITPADGQPFPNCPGNIRYVTKEQYL
jgi:hypothetical protein